MDDTRMLQAKQQKKVLESQPYMSNVLLRFDNVHDCLPKKKR